MKSKTPLVELCNNIPVEFNKYMSYVKSLGFFDEPNYNYLKKLFRTLFLKENFQYDDKYDWIKDGKFIFYLKWSQLFLCCSIDPTNGTEKRNMFEKFKSVNPAPTIKIEMGFKEFNIEESLRMNED